MYLSRHLLIGKGSARSVPWTDHSQSQVSCFFLRLHNTMHYGTRESHTQYTRPNQGLCIPLRFHFECSSSRASVGLFLYSHNRSIPLHLWELVLSMLTCTIKLTWKGDKFLPINHSHNHSAATMMVYTIVYWARPTHMCTLARCWTFLIYLGWCPRSHTMLSWWHQCHTLLRFDTYDRILLHWMEIMGLSHHNCLSPHCSCG